MKDSYQDITSRIAETPAWHDENGAPRYGEFTPDRCANIYWDECALLLISCQNCGHEFRVCMTRSQLTPYRIGIGLDEDVRGGTIHYGDPPNAGCCPSGPTMNCNDLRVLEFWKRESLEKVRVPELEIELPDAKECE